MVFNETFPAVFVCCSYFFAARTLAIFGPRPRKGGTPITLRGVGRPD